jgi:hypothetical protein
MKRLTAKERQKRLHHWYDSLPRIRYFGTLERCLSPLTPHVRAQAFFTSRVTTDSLPCAMTFASIRLALRLDYYVYFIIHTISLFNQWAGYPAHIQSD